MLSEPNRVPILLCTGGLQRVGFTDLVPQAGILTLIFECNDAAVVFQRRVRCESRRTDSRSTVARTWGRRSTSLPKQSTTTARRNRPPHRPRCALHWRQWRRRAPLNRAARRRAPVSAPSSARCGPVPPCNPRRPPSIIHATVNVPIPDGPRKQRSLPRWFDAGDVHAGTQLYGSAPWRAGIPAGIPGGTSSR